MFTKIGRAVLEKSCPEKCVRKKMIKEKEQSDRRKVFCWTGKTLIIILIITSMKTIVFSGNGRLCYHFQI